jgi:hypothetical protein
MTFTEQDWVSKFLKKLPKPHFAMAMAISYSCGKCMNIWKVYASQFVKKIIIAA